MRKPKQLSLIKDPRKNTKLWWIRKQNVYGGSLNYRKVARPFDHKKLAHTVLKANLPSALRFTKSTKSIRKLLEKVAVKNQIKVRDLAINHDHIHLVLQAGGKEDLTAFLRTFTAEMGKQYKRIAKRLGVKFKGSLWLHRPFTRLVSWGKLSREKLKKYLAKNRGEALGFLKYEPRKHHLNQFLVKWTAQLAGAAANSSA